ncbi:hypothetical protein [Nocardiopsis trehalosi]|uniref:hypothetical protein n=1 Tax=Nocardiopsis trehalosi TaxID=109329 RepID=UPI0008374081|nr:hypothetical protein [Nocardiopsis trehalosi]
MPLPALPEPDVQPGPAPRPPEPEPPQPGPIEPGPEPSPPPPPEPEPEFPEPDPSPGPPPPDPEDQPEPEPAEEAEGGPLDCGMLEVSCHVSNWFHDLVSDALNPLFGWLAKQAFRVPMPTDGVEELWRGVLITSNTLFVLLVMIGGAVVMGQETWQKRSGAGEVLGRIVFAFAASNFSLWIVEEMFTAANGVSAAVASDGVNPEEAARNLHERMDVLLMEAVVFILLLLVAAVVLLVVWAVMDMVRIVLSIVLVIAAPLLLMFHAVPATNRLAELWWRSMVGLCAVPICQSIAFIAFMRLFFEGQFTYFGSFEGLEAGAGPVPGAAVGPSAMVASRLMVATAQGATGTGGVFYSLILFLVMLYLQIRIPFWIWKLVWSPRLGASPIVGLGRTVAMMLLYRGIKGLRLRGGEPVHMGSAARRPGARATLTRLRPTGVGGRPRAAVGAAPGTGVQPLQPNIWWYRHRSEPPVPGAVPTSARRQITGPRALPAAPDPGDPPPPRPHPGTPPRPSLGDGRFPRRPRGEQQELFRPITPPGPAQQQPVAQRWRQGVLPTPPPQRHPGRPRGQRLGEVFDAPPPTAPPRLKGQRSLFPNPRKHWVQRGLPFTTSTRKPRRKD